MIHLDRVTSYGLANCGSVQSNHVEKTQHPCHFPVEWIERPVLSLSNEGDCVFDPFLEAETSVIAAVRHGRKAIGTEFHSKYVEIACHRIGQELDDTLRPRPMDKAIYAPKQAGNSLAKPPWGKTSANRIY